MLSSSEGEDVELLASRSAAARRPMKRFLGKRGGEGGLEASISAARPKLVSCLSCSIFSSIYGFFFNKNSTWIGGWFFSARLPKFLANVPRQMSLPSREIIGGGALVTSSNQDLFNHCLIIH